MTGSSLIDHRPSATLDRIGMPWNRPIMKQVRD
jgi:hypothetical protein